MATSTNSKSSEKPAEKPKAKRVQLTDEERIAKAEAELKAMRDKAQAKVDKQVTELLGRRKAKTDKIAQLQAEVNELTQVLTGLGYTGDVAPADVEQPELPVDEG